MWLAGSRMLSRIEETKELFSIIPVCFQTLVRRIQIILLQQIRLFFEVFCCQYKVIWNDWKLVQDEVVGG